MTLALSNQNIPLQQRTEAADKALAYFNALVRRNAFEIKAQAANATADDVQNFEGAWAETEQLRVELEGQARLLATHIA